MLMPKASMNEDYLTPPYKNQVRLTGKIAAMQPVTVSQSINRSADCHLGLHAGTANAPHIGAPALTVELIHEV
jgi:hypothetical protein